MILVDPSLVHLSRKPYKTRKMPRLRTENRQLTKIGGLILLQLRIGNLRTRMCFGIVWHLAVNVLIGTHFIDRFIRETFLTEHMVVSWHSPPVAILTRNHQREKKPNTEDVYSASPNDEHNIDTEDS